MVVFTCNLRDCIKENVGGLDAIVSKSHNTPPPPPPQLVLALIPVGNGKDAVCAEATGGRNVQ